MHCQCSNCDPLQGKLPIPDAQSVTPLSLTKTKLHVLGVGLLLSGSFSLFEWAAGWWSHSLTLVTDAGHMMMDCFAMGLALGATYLGHLASRRQASVGQARAEILAALANGLLLLVLTLWVFWEAMNRFSSTHPAVVTHIMLLTAVVGLGVNIVAASVLHNHSHHDLNIQGAFLHILADAASSAGVIISAILISAFHWNWADEVVSLLIAALIGLGALPLIWSSAQSLHKSYKV
jgi:cobalt-zinc-cadmium efflux system protein